MAYIDHAEVTFGVGDMEDVDIALGHLDDPGDLEGFRKALHDDPRLADGVFRRVGKLLEGNAWLRDAVDNEMGKAYRDALSECHAAWSAQREDEGKDAPEDRYLEVSYVPENSEDGKPYLWLDFLAFAHGNEGYARDLVDRVDGQHPETLVEEDLQYGEIVEFDGRYYLVGCDCVTAESVAVGILLDFYEKSFDVAKLMQRDWGGYPAGTSDYEVAHDIIRAFEYFDVSVEPLAKAAREHGHDFDMDEFEEQDAVLTVRDAGLAVPTDATLLDIAVTMALADGDDLVYWAATAAGGAFDPKADEALDDDGIKDAFGTIVQRGLERLHGIPGGVGSLLGDGRKETPATPSEVARAAKDAATGTKLDGGEAGGKRL